jgi:gamma-glutamyl hercynylcysteine S-oxide hydrolase
MCRMVGYLGGPPTPLSSVVLEGEHSLLVQSYAPREMMSGVVNADGFGVGWYVPEDEEPAVYRSNGSLWSDRSFGGIAPRIRARTIFAAVRNATPGLPVEESGVPPFSSGPFMFMHNGAIPNFRQTAMRPLRERLSDEAYSRLLGVSDSETIFAGLLDLLRDDPADLVGAVRETIRLVTEVCGGLGIEATLNLSVTDGTTMAFTRYSTDGPGTSLYVLEDTETFPGAVVVASERLDVDPGWRKVPDRHLLSVNRGSGATLRPL